MGPFKYLEPQTIQETISLLSKYGNKAKLLAGGTSLVSLMKEKAIRPEYVISIGKIADLNYIRFDGDKRLRIGSLTTIRSIEQSPQLQPKYWLICQAARQMASTSVRNVATVGGNLCNASPSADMVPALIVLSAGAKLISIAGERIVYLDDLFTGPGSTILKSDELMTEIQIPITPAYSAGAYMKYTTRGGEELPVGGVAVLLTLGEEDGTCTNAKVALGAVAPTPMRARETEKVIIGKKIDEELIKKAALIASNESNPIDDIYVSAEYKRAMIKVVARDAIREATELAKSAV
jgi:carbon-monoxide dehydrogenase medium subunit